MGLSQRPRGASLPVAMEPPVTTIISASARTRRTIVMNLEGVVLDDMDALVSVHGKPMALPPTGPPAMPDRASTVRRGSTSNCFSKRNPRRRRRRTTPSQIETGDSNDTDTNNDSDDVDGSFFVDDEPVPVLAGSVVHENGNGQVNTPRRPYGATNRKLRATSMPLTSSQINGNAPLSSATVRRRHTDQPLSKLKPTKSVTFKNAYEPELIPETRQPVQSYDELLFNVAGLYHTLSFLHDADFFDDGSATDTSTTASSSDNASDHSSASSSAPPPPERSMQLMIAEFLYRSAVYLGYPPDDHVWVPGFRDKKKFSSNDVKRWRRLAHFDWAAEERAFAQDHADRQALLTQGSSRVSTRWSRISSRTFGTATTYGRETTTGGVRSTVSNWLHFGSRSARDRSPPTSAALVPVQLKTKTRPLPTLLMEPPVVPPTTDLTKLVEVANACVSYGAIRFTERQIRKLCNIAVRK